MIIHPTIPERSTIKKTPYWSLGFTILEILVVISIIAIMIGIAGPRIKGLRDEGNVSKARRELKTLQAAVESYRSNHANTNPNGITTDLTGAFPQIISAALTDPFSAAGYRYSVSEKYYAISSVGLNGTNETAAIQSSGNVPSSGDDMVMTNGTITALDLSADTNNCGTIGTACNQGSGETCTNGACAPAGLGFGAHCTQDSDCISQICNSVYHKCRDGVEGDACNPGQEDCASEFHCANEDSGNWCQS